MSLKYLILFFLLLSGSVTNAQISVSVAHGNQHVLYRGYENPVFLNSRQQDYWTVFSTNSTLVKDSVSHSYLVKPFVESKTCALLIVDSITKDTLFSKTFDVISLPDPEIHFSWEEPGCGGSAVFARYDKKSPLKNTHFEVIRYEAFLNASYVASGTGNWLNYSVLSLFKETKPGIPIHFLVEVAGPDKIRRFLSTTLSN